MAHYVGIYPASICPARQLFSKLIEPHSNQTIQSGLLSNCAHWFHDLTSYSIPTEILDSFKNAAQPLEDRGLQDLVKLFDASNPDNRLRLEQAVLSQLLRIIFRLQASLLQQEPIYSHWCRLNQHNRTFSYYGADQPRASSFQPFEGTSRKSFGRYFANYSPFLLPDNVPCHMLMGTCRRRILWLSLWMVMKKLLVLYTAAMTHYGRGGRSSLRSNAARNYLALRVEISALGESRWLVAKSLNLVLFKATGKIKMSVKSRPVKTPRLH